MNTKSKRLVACAMALVVAFALCVPAVAHAGTAKAMLKDGKATKITLYQNIKAKKSVSLSVKGQKAAKGVWKSSKKKVATVKAGKVTAKKAGKTTITVKYGKKKYTAKVTVKKVAISKKKATLTVGGQALTLKLKGDKLKKAKSSAKDIASVKVIKGKAVVTAKKAGTATITLTSKNKAKLKCKVTVKTAAVEEPTMPTTPTEPSAGDDGDRPSAPSIPTTGDDDVAAPTEPSTPAGPAEPTDPQTPSEPVTPTQPDNPDDPGTPATPVEPSTPDTPDTPDTPGAPDTPDTPTTPETPGTPTEPGADEPETPAEPTTPAEPGTPEEPATIAVTGVKFAKSELALKVDDAAVANPATVEPADATEKTVSYQSSNERVATVDASGNVKPIAFGEAIITATSADGGKTATCKVTVRLADRTEVTSSAALNDLLKQGAECKTIVFKTDESKAVIDGAKEASGIDLIVDAPKASIDNYVKWKSVTVNAIATDTYTEHANNEISVSADKAHVVVAPESTASLSVEESVSNLVIENNGTIQALTVNTGGTIELKGESAAEAVPTQVNAPATLKTSQPLDMTANAQATVVLYPGSEGTTATAADEAHAPVVSGISTVEFTVQGSSDASRTIVAEYSEDVAAQVSSAAAVIGSVQDDESAPVAGAKVYLFAYTSEFNLADFEEVQTAKPAVVTADDGSYEFSDVKAGNYVIVVSCDGYATTSQELYLGNGETAARMDTITLDKETVEPDPAETQDDEWGDLYIKGMHCASPLVQDYDIDDKDSDSPWIRLYIYPEELNEKILNSIEFEFGADTVSGEWSKGDNGYNYVITDSRNPERERVYPLTLYSGLAPSNENLFIEEAKAKDSSVSKVDVYGEDNIVGITGTVTPTVDNIFDLVDLTFSDEVVKCRVESDEEGIILILSNEHGRSCRYTVSFTYDWGDLCVKNMTPINAEITEVSFGRSWISVYGTIESLTKDNFEQLVSVEYGSEVASHKVISEHGNLRLLLKDAAGSQRHYDIDYCYVDPGDPSIRDWGDCLISDVIPKDDRITDFTLGDGFIDLESTVVPITKDNLEELVSFEYGDGVASHVVGDEDESLYIDLTNAQGDTRRYYVSYTRSWGDFKVVSAESKDPRILDVDYWGERINVRGTVDSLTPENFDELLAIEYGSEVVKHEYGNDDSTDLVIENANGEKREYYVYYERDWGDCRIAGVTATDERITAVYCRDDAIQIYSTVGTLTKEQIEQLITVEYGSDVKKHEIVEDDFGGYCLMLENADGSKRECRIRCLHDWGDVRLVSMKPKDARIASVEIRGNEIYAKGTVAYDESNFDELFDIEYGSGVVSHELVFDEDHWLNLFDKDGNRRQYVINYSLSYGDLRIVDAAPNNPSILSVDSWDMGMTIRGTLPELTADSFDDIVTVTYGEDVVKHEFSNEDGEYRLTLTSADGSVRQCRIEYERDWGDICVDDAKPGDASIVSVSCYDDFMRVSGSPESLTAENFDRLVSVTYGSGVQSHAFVEEDGNYYLRLTAADGSVRQYDVYYTRDWGELRIADAVPGNERITSVSCGETEMYVSGAPDFTTFIENFDNLVSVEYGSLVVDHNVVQEDGYLILRLLDAQGGNRDYIISYSQDFGDLRLVNASSSDSRIADVTCWDDGINVSGTLEAFTKEDFANLVSVEFGADVSEHELVEEGGSLYLDLTNAAGDTRRCSISYQFDWGGLCVADATSADKSITNVYFADGWMSIYGTLESFSKDDFERLVAVEYGDAVEQHELVERDGGLYLVLRGGGLEREYAMSYSGEWNSLTINNIASSDSAVTNLSWSNNDYGQSSISFTVYGGDPVDNYLDSLSFEFGSETVSGSWSKDGDEYTFIISDSQNPDVTRSYRLETSRDYGGVYVSSGYLESGERSTMSVDNDTVRFTADASSFDEIKDDVVFTYSEDVADGEIKQADDGAWQLVLTGNNGVTRSYDIEFYNKSIAIADVDTSGSGLYSTNDGWRLLKRDSGFEMPDIKFSIGGKELVRDVDYTMKVFRNDPEQGFVETEFSALNVGEQYYLRCADTSEVNGEWADWFTAVDAIDISSASIVMNGSLAVGEAPVITVEFGGAALSEGTDFTVAYRTIDGEDIADIAEAAPGEYEVVVTGCGVYTGSLTQSFALSYNEFLVNYVSPMDGSEYGFNSTSDEETLYIACTADSFEAIKDELEVSCGKDVARSEFIQSGESGGWQLVLTGVKGGERIYDVAYTNKSLHLASFNNAGSGLVFTGNGNYIVSHDGVFTAPNVSFSDANGNLVLGEDYEIVVSRLDDESGWVEVSFDELVLGGEYYLQIKGIGEYSGELAWDVVASEPLDISTAIISAESECIVGNIPWFSLDYENAGLTEDLDYSVSYRTEDGEDVADIAAASPGNYQIVVTGKGGFTGVVTCPFVIVEVPAEG